MSRGSSNLGGVANLGGEQHAHAGGAQKGLFIAAFHEIEDKFVSGFKFENKSLSNSKPKLNYFRFHVKMLRRVLLNCSPFNILLP